MGTAGSLTAPPEHLGFPEHLDSGGTLGTGGNSVGRAELRLEPAELRLGPAELQSEPAGFRSGPAELQEDQRNFQLTATGASAGSGGLGGFQLDNFWLRQSRSESRPPKRRIGSTKSGAGQPLLSWVWLTALDQSGKSVPDNAAAVHHQTTG